jgi:hypothetical protein
MLRPDRLEVGQTPARPAAIRTFAAPEAKTEILHFFDF